VVDFVTNLSRLKQSDDMQMNLLSFLLFELRFRRILKYLLIVTPFVYTYECKAEPPGTKLAGARSIQIKLEETKTTTEAPKKSIPLSGSAGELTELRCLASLLTLETGKRVNVRLIVRINGKRTTAAVGVGDMRRSDGDVEELAFPLRLPAKPGLYQLEISQNQALLLAGDFRVVKAPE
jgi:hypothetical protein